MALAQRIDLFLTMCAPDPYCDDCLTKELREQTSSTAERLAAAGGFVRQLGDCSECGRRATVNHALLKDR